MASFYSPGDQELYKQFQYLPQEQFRLGLNLPKNTEAEAVNTTFGILSSFGSNLILIC